VHRAAALAVLAAVTPYTTEIHQWRRAREASLKSETGWLTVAGLFWLKDGPNRFGTAPDNEIVLPEGPAHAGVFQFHNGRTTLKMGDETRELKSDDARNPVRVGNLTMFAIRRGDRHGIRMRNPNGKLRREFTGLHWFAVKPQYRIVAKFVPQPSKLPVGNVLGQTEEMASPGYAEFQLHGQALRLYPVQEGKSLFFIFRDQTSGRETYGAGRFLDAAPPNDGTVTLDFNKAYNPPCAFTPYATCPLPPRQNRLAARVEAGEMNYGH
jgi:uncharacterized protein